jgi:hypothetical protein
MEALKQFKLENNKDNRKLISLLILKELLIEAH